VAAPSTKWRTTLWIMVGIQMLSVGSFYFALPFIPFQVEQLGVHDPAAVDLWSGIIFSINALTGALFAPLWGDVADRVGRKAMVVRSSIFGGLTAAMMAFSPNVWLLTTSRALMGVAGGFTSAAAALVGSVAPESELGFALGWMTTGQIVGTLMGPVVGGLVIDATHDYRSIYLLTTLGTWTCAFLCWRFVRENFTRAAPTSAPRLPIWRQFAAIVRTPEMMPMFGMLVLGQVAILSTTPVIALYVRQIVGPSPLIGAYVGASFAVMGIADLLASPFLGKRSDKIGYRKVLLISIAGAAICTIPQAFVHDIRWFLALRFGVGIFLGGIIPTAIAWIGRQFPAEQRGRVYGVTYSAMFLGQFIGPAFGGALAARLGIASVFVATGLFMVLNFVWVARGVRSS
jgi:DHA1 family multidrug resistance protein-like MFS transporter